MVNGEFGKTVHENCVFDFWRLCVKQDGGIKKEVAQLNNLFFYMLI